MKLAEVATVRLQDVCEARGRLTAIERGAQVPFDIQRVFYVHQVPPEHGRGGHAHRDTDQLLVPVYGSFKVGTCSGRAVPQLFTLADPSQGLLVPRMTWTWMYDFSPGAVMLALANTLYDRSRSIRDWAEYARVTGADPSLDPANSRRRS